MQPVRYLTVSSALALGAVLGSLGCGGSTDDDSAAAPTDTTRVHALSGPMVGGPPIIDKAPCR